MYVCMYLCMAAGLEKCAVAASRRIAVCKELGYVSIPLAARRRRNAMYLSHGAYLPTYLPELVMLLES